MAQTGFVPLQLYYSTTASAVPLAANLAPGELALNITDGVLFYEDNGGVVQRLAVRGPASQGGAELWLTSVAGTNTITATVTPAITAYAAGQTFRFVAAGANTGAATLNIGGLGARDLTKGGTSPLGGGDIKSGSIVTVSYDGIRFQLSSVASLVPSGTTAQRPASPQVGAIYSNTDLLRMEWWNGSQWAAMGGGATGGGTDAGFIENDTEATQNHEIGSNELKSGVTITIASPAVFTLAAHGFAVGQQVRLKTTGALPTGLAQTNYFVIAAGFTTSTFQLSATRGGAAINTSGSQSGVHSVGKCKNATTGGPYTTLDGVNITVPDGCAWTIV
jgi:hypothetical protein